MNHRRNSVKCGDELTLQKFLDSALDDVALELVFHHVESCQRCADVVNRLGQARALCEDQLGLEDEAETDFAEQALGRVRAQIKEAIAHQQTVRPRRRWWPYMAVAAVVLTILAIPIVSEHKTEAFAEEILIETLQREKTWEWQPHKVLHWIIESQTVINQAEIPEKNYRTFFWRNNLGSRSEFLYRRYDSDNRLVSASWRRFDGSRVKFDSEVDDEVLEIIPSTAKLRDASQEMEPSLRQAIEQYLEGQQQHQVGELIRFGYMFRRGENTHSTVKIRKFDGWGDVYYIRSEEIHPAPSRGTARLVTENYIQRGTFKRLRVRSTRYKVDGRVEVQDSRWVYFEEASAADFAANSLDDLIRSKHVIRLSPEDVARRTLAASSSRPSLKQ